MRPLSQRRRSTSVRTSTQKHVPQTIAAAVEGLEPRRLMCGLPHELLGPVPDKFDMALEQQFVQSQRGGPEAVGIIWANRGQASDGFASAFGNSANAGRAVVDAVFAQWSRIITSFNRSDGTTTLQVNLSMTAGGGFGAAGGPEAFPPADHKPRLGAVTVGRGSITPDANDSNGWFFDPTPMDNAEFLSTINNPYNATATNTGQGSDFFSVINAELAHCLGLISDRNNDSGNYGAYTLEDITDVTGIMDNAEGGGVFGSFQVFNGPNIRHLMTTYNSGDATGLSWGNVVHTAGGGNINFAGVNWVGTQDEGNAIYNGAERTMPSFVVARILSDAYNYSMVDPATFATAYTVLNQSTGVLTVRGSSSATSSDLLVLDVSGSELVVTVDIGEDVPGSGALPGAGNLGGFVTRVPLSSINSIVVNGGGGNDFIRIERNGGKTTTVNGDAGNDFIDFGFYNRNLSNQTGNVIVNGGTGAGDQIFVYDNIVASAQTFTVTSSRFDRPGWGGFFYADDLEALTLTTGTAADTVNVRSTFSGQPVNLNSAGGADVVNVGTTNGVQSISADLFVNNSPSFTTLNINDNSNVNATNSNVDFHGSTGYGRINNLAPARILWNLADIGSVNITTGTAADNLLVYSNTETMQINSNGGNDIVQIGDALVGGLGFITGQIAVVNGPAQTNLFISDAGNVNAKNAHMDFVGSSITGRITNLAPIPIIWNMSDMNEVNIITGGGDDQILMNSNNTHVKFNSSGGSDTIRFGSPGVGGTINIFGLADVDNDNGMTTVFIDDLGAANTKPNVSIDHPNGNQTNVQGMAPGIIRFNDNTTTYADIRTSGPASGVLNNRVTVLASATPLRIGNNGSLGDVVLGGGAQGASAITAPVHVFGPTNFTAVSFNDQTGTVPRNVTLDDDGTTATVTGFGPADHTFNIASVFNSYFVTGPLADVLNVYSARKPVIYRNLVNGSPTDEVIVGSPTTGLANVVANINTNNITFSPVSIYLEDSVNAVGRTYTFQPQTPGGILTANRIVFNGTNYVEHMVDAHCPLVSINAGSGSDAFHVPFVRPATYLYGNDGADVYNLGTHATLFSNPIYLYGPGGLDTLNVNADGGSTASAVLTSTMHFSSVLLGAGGNLSVAGGGDKVLSTRNLTLGANSKIDLVDNDMILDYTGATQLPAVQSLINAMRNGGTWDGTRGITSSYAASSTPPNNTLAAIEATEFEAMQGVGALFDGEALDADMVLVKHTYYGDTDFNGVVDFDDYSRVDSGFNLGRTGWNNGDVDGNGIVDFDDYSLIDQAFNTQLGGLRPLPTRVQADEGDEAVGGLEMLA
ncbi:MAG: hypothetical protein H7Z14_18175 [Anaerolineae bacterium]|nr:hypothetical protein [Phycisphaerae bacterium]